MRYFGWVLLLLLCLASTGPASLRAQVLPAVQVPNLPRVGGVLDDTLSKTTGLLDQQALRTLRETRARALIRNHRDVVEADPQGAPILRSEVVAVDPAAEALTQAKAAGFSVARESKLESLGLTLVVLRAPQGMSTRRALKELRAADPQGVYDYNHLYLDSGEIGEAVGTPPSDPVAQSSTAKVPGSKIGLIDSGVDGTHPAFHTASIVVHGCGGQRVPHEHGTAVASLLVGDATGFRGALSGATLYAADVYCGLPAGGAVDSILAALEWMAKERVAVVNISLVGPPNRMLERAVRAMAARGHVLVAAVGNDGPAAKPLYPAAYPEVIGVTGVDAKQRVLLEACRGTHVDLAAPGADITAATPGSTFKGVRGTSFAAPLVAGLLAAHLNAPDAAGATKAAQELDASAIDLGSTGRDKTYGAGFVGGALRAQLAARK